MPGDDAAGLARYNIPVVIGEAVGPAWLAAFLARSIVCPAGERGRSGGETSLCRGPVLFPDADGLWGPGERDPRPGPVGGIRLGLAGSLG